MQISTQNNNYQNMQIYQKETTQKPSSTVEPEVDIDVYNASRGNLIRDKDDSIILTPQGKNNIAHAKEDKTLQEQAEEKATQDAKRAVGTDYLAYKSMQSQVEIYLAVATDGEVSLDNDKTLSIIESLREVQKQNNVVEAYATYKKNQEDQDKPVFFA